jgi:hypothetical protein
MSRGKLLKEKWRRGQDSNLHILSDGGFQDRCNTIMRPLRMVLTNYKPGGWSCSNEDSLT